MSETLPRIINRATQHFVDNTCEMIALLHQFLEDGDLPCEFTFSAEDGSETAPSPEHVAVTLARCEMT